MSRRTAKLDIAAAALLFAALADETRLSLLQRLSRTGPASITTLAAPGDMTRQALTKHLHTLSQAGVIKGRREGREHLWALDPEGLAAAHQCLSLIARGWDDALSRLKSHLEKPPA